ncbi:MAG: hypothetical protein RI953_359 [Pseudomonadota bacterium]|jgi:dTDP-4-dehydrorhamnose reductase
MTSKKRGGVLIFGGGGTVGRALTEHISELAPRSVVHVWNRAKHPLFLGDPERRSFEKNLRPWLSQLSPSIVFNLAVAQSNDEAESRWINVDLPIWLSEVSMELGFRLVHTSSVMVFSQKKQGPYSLETRADAADGYGLQKRLAEDGCLTALRTKNASVTVARLGWQIGPNSEQNTIRRYLEDQASRNGGLIRANRLWIPSCSRTHQTAAKLWELAHQAPGLYQIEGNRGLNFADIVERLRGEYSATHWNVEKTEDFAYNQLMIDERVHMPPIFQD